MAIDYSKFDRMVDLDGLKDDLKNNKSGNYEEIPDGTYDVRLLAIELGETGPNSKNPGSPMVKAQFEILAGDFSERWVFMNQVVNTGAGLNIGLHFIRTMLPETEEHAEIRDRFTSDAFNSYGELGQLIDMLAPFIQDKFEYALNIKTNKKGYHTYTIEEIYELEE